MCFYMVLDSRATSYIGWPLPAFAIRSFDCVHLCRDSAIQASLMALAAPSIDNAKVLKISCDSKYRAV